MNWVRVIVILVVLFIICPMLIAAFCAMTDEPVHPPLRRRPNVKRVYRDDGEAA